MTLKDEQILTLDQRVLYEIRIPGELNASWSDWAETVTATLERDRDDSPVTTLTGTFDQAALHGFLRRLYALGIPLISIQLIVREQKDEHVKKAEG